MKDHSSDAKKPPKPQKKHRAPLPWPWALAIFCALLILPIWAGWVLSEKVDGRILLTYFVLISLLTFFFYWSDKRKAQKGQWRIPEGTLHLLEALGGWPAGLLAQRFLRHKTKKTSYQAVFWLLIVSHQLLAFEWISGGILLNRLASSVSELLG